jgi:hypothetical protein
MSTDSWLLADEFVRILLKVVLESDCACQEETAGILIEGEDIQDGYSAKHA